MGHKTIAMTARYSHLSPGHKKRDAGASRHSSMLRLVGDRPGTGIASPLIFEPRGNHLRCRVGFRYTLGTMWFPSELGPQNTFVVAIDSASKPFILFNLFGARRGA